MNSYEDGQWYSHRGEWLMWTPSSIAIWFERKLSAELNRVASLMVQSEPLPAECAKLLYENGWELYL